MFAIGPGSAVMINVCSVCAPAKGAMASCKILFPMHMLLVKLACLSKPTSVLARTTWQRTMQVAPAAQPDSHLAKPLSVMVIR